MKRSCFANVFLFVFPYCRMRCRYCIEPSTNRQPGVSRSSVIELMNLLSEHGTKRIWLSGGEGTLSPYILYYIEECRRLGMSPRFSTQDGKRLAQLAPDLHDMSIQLSLNGIKEDHDDITQVVGSFAELDGAIALLAPSISLSARVIIRPDMNHSVSECMSWCLSRGISKVFVSSISESGRGSKYLSDSATGRFSDREFAQIVEDLRSEFPKVSIDARHDEKMGTVCGVYPNGDVYITPTHDADGRTLLGNAREDGFDRLFERFGENYPDYYSNYMGKITTDGTLRDRTNH